MMIPKLLSKKFIFLNNCDKENNAVIFAKSSTPFPLYDIKKRETAN